MAFDPSDRRLVYLIDYLQEAIDKYVHIHRDTTRQQVAAALRHVRNGVEWDASLQQHLRRAVDDYQEQHPAAKLGEIAAGLRECADGLGRPVVRPAPAA